jgi:hypothetical protein
MRLQYKMLYTYIHHVTPTVELIGRAAVYSCTTHYIMSVRGNKPAISVPQPPF